MTVMEKRYTTRQLCSALGISRAMLIQYRDGYRSTHRVLDESDWYMVVEHGKTQCYYWDTAREKIARARRERYTRRKMSGGVTQ